MFSSILNTLQSNQYREFEMFNCTFVSKFCSCSLRKKCFCTHKYVEMNVMLKLHNFNKRLVILNTEKEIKGKKHLWY
jgi:hypothetical protein